MSVNNPAHRANVEKRILSRIELIDASQACALLQIETDDAVGAIQAMAREGGIITLVQNDEISLPLFQFDTTNDKVFDVVREILQSKPARISNLRLTYWLTRAHVDFSCAPAARFGADDAAILDAFWRYIQPVCHG